MTTLRRGEGGSTAILILGINVLLVLPGHAAPTTTSNDFEATWNRMNVLSSEVSPSRGGCCLEWLQKLENHDNVAKYARDNTVARLQLQDEPSDSMEMGSWKSPFMLAKIKSPIVKQPSAYNRLTKKDVFMSRGWGAGSMPFSVLYMNPHSSRVNSPAGVSHAAESARALPLEGLPPASVSSKHPNYRVALRNGASGQPRRQYSIIPQLFVSYGWSPVGK